jgi:hypothetical protein
VNRSSIDETLASLARRERVCWDMAGVFLENRDAHGLMDIGAELQSLKVAIAAVTRMGEGRKA